MAMNGIVPVLSVPAPAGFVEIWKGRNRSKLRNVNLCCTSCSKARIAMFNPATPEKRMDWKTRILSAFNHLTKRYDKPTIHNFQPGFDKVAPATDVIGANFFNTKARKIDILVWITSTSS